MNPLALFRVVEAYMHSRPTAHESFRLPEDDQLCDALEATLPAGTAVIPVAFRVLDEHGKTVRVTYARAFDRDGMPIAAAVQSVSDFSPRYRTLLAARFGSGEALPHPEGGDPARARYLHDLLQTRLARPPARAAAGTNPALELALAYNVPRL